MSIVTTMSLPHAHGGATGVRTRYSASTAGGGPSPARKAVRLPDTVGLFHSLRVEGLLLAAAARGTLVDIATNGDFGTVEFTWPIHAIVTLPIGELRLAAA